ncbi:ATP-dependent DNA ligase [Paenibacillus sp. y28]|uniref:ATP-dependent DNA ligase n=1 Tax=Paenibacillus sp. y28 TaxID=3129110 RepID=UPI003019B7A8
MKLKPVAPFEPVYTERLPEKPNWIAQVKWDGVRMLLYCDGEDVRLVNRRLNDRTLQYPEFARPTRYCSASAFILDGEIIAFDNNKPSFHEIMKRDSLRKQQAVLQGMRHTPVTYMIFDMLYCNGEWLLDKPLKERQAMLEKTIIPQPDVQLVPSFTDAAGLLSVMKQHQMEGIVCKDLNSTYAINSKDARWQKYKITHDLFAVVGGVTYRSGTVNALLLGLYDADGRLNYIGHAGAGKFTVRDWRELTRIAPSLTIASRPFASEPERSKEAVWLLPKLTVKVEYLEFTPGGTMRHPVLQARMDISPSECTVDQLPKPRSM